MEALIEGNDLVYHCAAAPHEGLSVFSPHYISQNVFGVTTSVLSASISAKVKRFVLLSSMARYGSPLPPFTEDMVPIPQDPYGISKYASELMLVEMARTHGMEYSIAVPHNVIGTRQKYDDPYRNVASIFINMMLQGQPPIVYGDGRQLRSFSFIDDVIDPLVLMGILPEARGEIINVGPDGNEITIHALAEIIAELTGFRGDFIHMPDRPCEVKNASCSANKARLLLGYEAKKDLREGLAEMVDWIRTRGVKPFQYYLPVEIQSDLLPTVWREQRANQGLRNQDDEQPNTAAQQAG
jgi:UDP-glucose 4-epimerase